MKRCFYAVVMDDSEITNYITEGKWHNALLKNTSGFPKYETIKKRLMSFDCPKRIIERLDALYEEWRKPAPPMPSVAEKEQMICEFIAMFQPSTDFKNETFQIERGGFKYHIGRAFLPDRIHPVNERDVEYHISGYNYDEAHTKKEYKRWSCWVYINREGYLDAFNYKSIPGTDYGVQWFH